MLISTLQSKCFLCSRTGMKTRVERAQRENDKILEHMVKDHQENRNKHGVTHEDFIDILLKTQKRDDLEIPLTHNNVKALIWVSMQFSLTLL